MILGNELAIELGLDVLYAEKYWEECTLCEMAAYIDAARIILGLDTEPFRPQDMWHLYTMAVRKMRRSERWKKARVAKSLVQNAA